MRAALEVVGQMFGDLGTPDNTEGWRDGALQAFAERAASAAIFVASEQGRIVGVAAGVIDQRLPSPRRPSGRLGYVEWLGTLPSHRRRGVARLALRALLNWFVEHDIAVIDVHASEQAHALYLDLGFAAPRATALRWRG
jgi:GNAT superfamily N-acetyltransferase